MCAEHHCDYNGFIAYEKSPRHLPAQKMNMLASYVPSGTQKVLVTVDASNMLFDEYITALQPDMLQLHGHEDFERIKEIKQRYNLPVIKAIAVKKQQDLLSAKAFEEVADMLLLDTKKADGSSGGTGVTFDWSILDDFQCSKPYFLSGGIGAHNAKIALDAAYTPYLDVSSSLEEQKGVKSPAKIKDFFAKLS